MKLIDAHIHLKPSEDAAVSSLLHQMDKQGVEKSMLILNVKDEYEAFIKDFQTYSSNKNRLWLAIGINIHDEC